MNLSCLRKFSFPRQLYRPSTFDASNRAGPALDPGLSHWKYLSLFQRGQKFGVRWDHGSPNCRCGTTWQFFSEVQPKVLSFPSAFCDIWQETKNCTNFLFCMKWHKINIQSASLYQNICHCQKVALHPFYIEFFFATFLDIALSFPNKSTLT